MVAPAKLVNPNAGPGWEQLRVVGSARIGDLGVWSRNGSVSSVLGAVALLGDLTSHAVQAGFNVPAMHHMVLETDIRNIVSDDEANNGFSGYIYTSGIPAGSVLYLLDYTENVYLYTGNAGDIDVNGYIHFSVAAGEANQFQDGIHSCIGIIDPPDAKPIIFDFFYSRDAVMPPPGALRYNGAVNHDGSHKYDGVS